METSWLTLDELAEYLKLIRTKLYIGWPGEVRFPLAMLGLNGVSIVWRLTIGLQAKGRVVPPFK